MNVLGVASLLTVAGALAAPAPARAVDHVSLSVGPIALKGKPGWRLTAFAPSMGPSDEEILGVTLRRKFLNGIAQEDHALRHSLSPAGRTFTFDGQRGRWRTHGLFGDVLTISMTVRASGPARDVDTDFRGCRGDIVEVPVLLRGSFVLRTKTRFFRTIRRAQLRGLARYNRGGPFDCTLTPATTCVGGTQFSASPTGAGASRIAVSSEAGRPWLHLASHVPMGRTGPTWYHWMSVEGIPAIDGSPPTFEVRPPPTSPITGSGTFTATTTSESTLGACRVTRYEGTFVGTFRTRFTGWGVRTLAIDTRNAFYSVFT
jgi:hypothetical protein